MIAIVPVLVVLLYPSAVIPATEEDDRKAIEEKRREDESESSPIITVNKEESEEPSSTAVAEVPIAETTPSVEGVVNAQIMVCSLPQNADTPQASLDSDALQQLPPVEGSHISSVAPASLVGSRSVACHRVTTVLLLEYVVLWYVALDVAVLTVAMLGSLSSLESDLACRSSACCLLLLYSRSWESASVYNLVRPYPINRYVSANVL